jgi:glycine/D-amino acid oxidase-like deaminating enzyme
MKRLYEDRAYDPAWPESWWRASVSAPPPHLALSGSLTVDAAIVGAGYAGLSAAIDLAQAGQSVAVLDASQPGWGASGRNGGFVCIGGTKLSNNQIVARVGVHGARDFRRFQIAAMDHVAEVVDAHAIPARQGPAGEAYLAHSPAAWEGLLADAEAETRLYREAPDLVPPGALAERGLSGPGFHGAALARHGFPIHPMIYVEALAALAGRAGARVFGDSAVTGLAADRGGWRVATAGGEVNARKVLIATNGYGAEDLPPWIGGRTLPAMSSILVTRPLTQSELGAQGFTTALMSCDVRKLLHYFRHLPDGRFLFGMRGGTSASASAEADTLARVRRHFDALFPAWAGAATTHAWSGFVCLTGSLAPFTGPVPGTEGLFATFGCHGGGVALQSWSGTQAARLMRGEDADLPALVRAPPRRMPFAAFRRLGLRLAYAGYARKDGPLPGRPHA